jgi:hypothetical protein
VGDRGKGSKQEYKLFPRVINAMKKIKLASVSESTGGGDIGADVSLAEIEAGAGLRRK